MVWNHRSQIFVRLLLSPLVLPENEVLVFHIKYWLFGMKDEWSQIFVRIKKLVFGIDIKKQNIGHKLYSNCVLFQRSCQSASLIVAFRSSCWWAKERKLGKWDYFLFNRYVPITHEKYMKWNEMDFSIKRIWSFFRLSPI